MSRLHLHQIVNGLGAGNIGDEMMAHAFWSRLPSSVDLTVEVFPNHKRQRQTYPQRFKYEVIPEDFQKPFIEPVGPGVLVGTTLVTDREGAHWPLEMIGKSLERFHKAGLPVHAVGIGADRLRTTEGRRHFRRYFSRISTWTVRSNRSKETLVELGIREEDIAVGADWAWLYQPPANLDEYAVTTLEKSGVDLKRPLVMVNYVALNHSVRTSAHMASALDELTAKHGVQVVFACNEVRDQWPYEAAAAKDVQQLMRQPSIFLPNDYYSPAEMIAMLKYASAAICYRYHFSIESVFAGTVPIIAARGPKLSELAEELDLPAHEPKRFEEAGYLVKMVSEAIASREATVSQFEGKRQKLAERATINSQLLEREHASAFGALAQSQEIQLNRPRKKIYLMQLGGLGDLVLTARMIGPLRQRYPKHELVLVVRSPFVGITSIFEEAPDAVLPIGFNPYSSNVPNAELHENLNSLVSQLDSANADVFISAEYQPTWLSWFIAAALGTNRNYAASTADRPAGLLDVVLESRGLSAPDLEIVRPREGTREVERYARLLKKLGARNPSSQRWALSKDAEEAAASRLAAWELAPKGYIACFPGGSATTAPKRWPTENYRELLTIAAKELKLAVVLIGDRSELRELELLASNLQLAGARTFVFAGGDKDLPELAGLLANAQCYAGNDTGPSHLAQAYETPGIVLFGGGAWPAYGPWGRGTVGLVHPLPCFNCGWDCVFQRGFCVELIGVNTAMRALNLALAFPTAQPRIRNLDDLPAGAEAFIERASKVHRELKKDHQERLVQIVQLSQYNAKLSSQLTEARSEQNVIKLEADRRVQGLVELTRIIAERDSRIRELENAASERLKALVAGGREIAEARSQAEQRDVALLELTSLLGARDRRIEELERTAEERLSVLLEADRKLKDMDAVATAAGRELQQLQAHIQQRERQVAVFEKAAAERLESLLKLDSDFRDLADHAKGWREQIDQLTEVIHSRDKRIVELETAASERLDALRDAEGRILRLQRDLEASGAKARELSAAASAFSSSSSLHLADLSFVVTRLEEAHAGSELQRREILALNDNLRDRDARITQLLDELEARLAELERGSDAGTIDAVMSGVENLHRENEERETAAEYLGDLMEKGGQNLDELITDAESELLSMEAAAVRIDVLEKLASGRAQAIEELTRIVLEGDKTTRHLLSETRSRLEALKQLSSEVPAATADQVQSLHDQLFSFTSLVANRDEQIAQLANAASERLSALEEADRKLRHLHASATEREQQIQALTQLVHGREQHLREVELAAREREKQILILTRQLTVAEQRISEVSEAAGSRLSQIQKLTSLVSEERHGAEQRLKQIETLTEMLAEQKTAAAERLAQVEQLTEIIGERSRTAEERLEQIERLTAIVAERTRLAEERLEQINALTAVVSERDTRIHLLEEAGSQRLEQIQILTGEVTARDRRMEVLVSTSEERLGQIHTLTAQIANRDRRLHELEETSGERLAQIHQLTSEIAARDSRVNELEESRSERLTQIVQLTDEIARRDTRIHELEQTSAERLSQIHSLGELLQQREAAILEFRTSAEARLEQIHTLTAEVNLRDKVIAQTREVAAIHELTAADLRTQLAEKDRQLNELREAIAALRSEVDVQRQAATRRAADVELLTATVRRLEARVAELDAAARDRLAALVAADSQLRDQEYLLKQAGTALDNRNRELEQSQNRIRNLETHYQSEFSQRQAHEQRIQHLLAELENTRLEGNRLAVLAGETAANEVLLLEEVVAYRKETLLDSVLRHFRSRSN